MSRPRCIVGIGEALLCEYPDRAEPGGLAVTCARQAKRLGCAGIPVSRLGQDLAANELLTQLKALGLNTEHLQSDPDLPTGRLVVRSIAGVVKRSLQSRAAFDNLQWDFDLVDIAQQADAVFFGELAQRTGQSQSIIRRFLAECTNAVRVFDLTNRHGEDMDRVQARSSLEYAEGLIVDEAALRALSPGWDGKHPQHAAADIIRSSQLAFVLAVERSDGNERLTAHTAGGSTSSARVYPTTSRDAAVVAFVYATLRGCDAPTCVESAAAIAEHAATHGDDPVPASLM